MLPTRQHEPLHPEGCPYQFLVENCADIMARVDTDHVVQYVSPSCLEILGWKPDEMVGKEFSDFVFPEDILVVQNAVSSFLEKNVPTARVRVRLIRREQVPVWISVNGRRVRDARTGEPRSYILTMQDITKRKILEEKLSHSR